MTEITYSESKGKIILHKDGANFALSFEQLKKLEALLPEIINSAEKRINSNVPNKND